MSERENIQNVDAPFKFYALGSVSGVKIRRKINEGIVVDGFGRIVVRDVDYEKIVVKVEKDGADDGNCVEATLEFGSIFKCDKGLLTVSNVGRLDKARVEFCLHFYKNVGFRPDDRSYPDFGL